MLSRPRLPLTTLLPLVGVALLALEACDSENGDDDASRGGTNGSGASGGSGANGGSAAGMPASGGAGGASGSGTSTSGGTASGGTTSGGAAGGGTGGASSAGVGGSATGGTTAGVGTTGGAGNASGGTAGSSAGTAGTSGAAAGGAGTGGTGADPCATALYCDDFEAYDTAPNGKWTPHSESGTVAIDGAEHVSGAKSVKFSTQSGDGATAMMRLQGSPIFPVAGNVVYGRMLFKLAAAPTASVHWTIITGFGLVSGQGYRADYRYGGQQPISQGNAFVGSQMMANYETPDWYNDKSTPGSDCWHHANGRVIPVAKWTCIEWKFDGANNGMQLWLDGMPADDLTVTGHGDGCVNAANDFPWTAPNFSSMDLGWESYQQDDARTAWIDDVVISTTPIGCP
jgi:hypothetical protein